MPKVLSKLSVARPSCLRLLVHWARRAASRAACTAGKRSEISTAMIAITTSSSISVKPVFLGVFVWTESHVCISKLNCVNTVASSKRTDARGQPSGGWLNPELEWRQGIGPGQDLDVEQGLLMSK